MTIVPFQTSDQETTAQFMNTIWDEMGWTDKPKTRFTDLAAFFHIPTDGFLLLMKDNNTIIGTGGCIRLNDTDALLKRFYIAKNYRGTGVAQQLLDAIILKSQELQASRIVIDVSKKNARATSFYEKGGFQPYKPTRSDLWPESFQPEIFHYYFLPIT